MKRSMRSILAGFAMAAIMILGSCSAPKDVAYFQDFDKVMVVEVQQRQSLKVRPDDKLQIIVTSKDPQLASLFNLPVVTSRLGQNASQYGTPSSFSTSSASSEGLTSYTVTPEGTIDFPVLGTLHVAGMSRAELAGYIKGDLVGRNLIKDPTVTVEFLNTGISVLGEVNSPGRYTLNRDELTILDAIAMSGDLTINGQRNNVRVMRKEGDQTKVYVVDLTSGKELYNNPAFYLQQDDVVYVEPNDFRKRATTVNGNQSYSASFWISVVSVCASLAVLIVNLVK